MLLPYQASITGPRAFDEECSCEERTARKQGGRRKMGVPHPAHKSEGSHLPVLVDSAFEYDGAALVDNDHPERRTTLAGFV